MKRFTEVMKALSDPNRVKIVKILQHRSMCVCELREALQVSQPTVSKHLKILERAGLVDYKKDGLWVDYFLTDGSTFVTGWKQMMRFPAWWIGSRLSTGWISANGSLFFFGV